MAFYCFWLMRNQKPLPFAEGQLMRKYFLDNIEMPLQSHVRRQLGPMAQVVFDFSCEEARRWLGIIPLMKGARDTWISPDSRIERKPRQTRPPRPRKIHMTAFNHQTILALGPKLVELLANKCRLEKEEALRLQAIDLEENCMIRLRETIERVRLEEEGKCEEIVETIMEHFDKCFREVVDQTTKRLRKQCELRVTAERTQLTCYMLEQLQNAVERRDLELCDDFYVTLEGEMNALTDRYLLQIEAERKVAIQILRETIERYERMLRELKRQMETSGIVEICRAIVEERKRCKTHSKNLEERFKNRMHEIFDVILRLKARNLVLKGMADERMRRTINWRNQMRVIMKELQKFISYAVEAIPEQSKYLLTLEKLLIKKFALDSYLTPADYEKFKSCVMKKLTPEERKSVNLFYDAEIQSEEGEFGPLCVLPPKIDPCDSYQFVYSYIESFSKKKESVKSVESSLVEPEMEETETKDSSSTALKNVELHRLLKLVGEEEKNVTLISDDEFLDLRTRALMKILKKDVETAMIFLGCSAD